MSNGETTAPKNSNPEPPTDGNRASGGRFAPGNQAARTVGLRSGVRNELRRRNRRSVRLLAKYLGYRADEGRAQSPTQLPLAKRFCELEHMAADLFSAWLLQPANDRFHQKYISTVRAQSLLASQLGETPASMARLTALQRDESAGEAHRELLELYRPKALNE